MLTAGEVLRAWTEAQPEAAYVVQPGVGTVPYAFRGVPAARTDGAPAAVPESLRG